jgi:regulator of protease activity HflC (stomatin/prohibitin superfamily)
MKKYKMLAAIMMFSLFSTGCVSCQTIEPGNVAVEVNWGTLNTHVYNPGFYTYSLFSDLYVMSTRMQTYTFGGTRERTQQQENQQNQEESNTQNIHRGQSIQILSNDQLAVNIDVTIQYHLNGTSGPLIYREFGLDYSEALIEVPVRSAVRNAASDYAARELVTHREEFQSKMERMISEQIALTLHAKHVSVSAIVVDNVSLRQIDLPDSLERSIRQVQEQEMQTLQRQSAVQTARQESERLRIEAEGAVAAQLIRANGTAEANRAISASLSSNILRLRELEAQYAMTANPNARIVVVPYGQPTVVNVPQQAITAATQNH